MKSRARVFAVGALLVSLSTAAQTPARARAGASRVKADAGVKSSAPNAPGTASPGDAPAPTVLPAAVPMASGSSDEASKAGSTDGGVKTQYYEGMGQSVEQQLVLDEFSQAIQTYENESQEFKKEVQLLVEKKYLDKRGALSESYEKAIRDLEVLERRERLDAIAAFEEFLTRYPDDPRYSPDVMFRLAELYYERSSDAQNVAMREYEETLKKLDPEKNPNPPAEPKVDFSKSIALYERLLTEFPNYKLNDASLYLLGYCLEKQENFERARGTYERLIAAYPKSRYATEAWMRIGENYFDAYDIKDALQKAAEAYEKAIVDKTHPLYDKALYKLGWTYYRMDRFDDAVDRFLNLTDFYEAQAKAKGEEEVGGDLRNEALQYTAISFVDEKWGSLAKAQEKFAKLGGRRYEGEIYRRMGDVYFDQTKELEAIEAYRLVLAKDPLTKDAPLIQQKIVKSYERRRMLNEAFTESGKLATAYQPGTPWYEKWKRDPEVIATVSDIAERSLYSTAIYHHQQAIVYKQEQKFELAKAAFETAARAYGAYLARFPRSKNAYEMEYYYAETLYNSFQFGEAAKHYAAVRDSSQDVRYLNDAAYSAVLSYQKQLDLDVKLGTTKAFPVRRSAERPEGDTVKPVAFTAAEAALVDSSDKYLLRVKKGDEKAPTIAYRAAELFYTHDQLEEARRRFEDIVKTYPKNEVAKYATNLIIESYLIDKDWKKVEEVSERLASNKDVIDPKSELYQQLTKFKLGGRFKLAEELMAKGDYDLAAKKYIELVDEDPKNEFADKALNNAAVSYENVQRFDSALKLYERIFKEYPNSKLADAAIFRVAVNAEKSYDFEKAISTYQRLVKDYPNSKDRESALYNTARLLEGLQKYDEAAVAYLRYADLYPKSEDAPKNQFRAALIYEKQEQPTKQIAALNEFVAKFSSNPKQVELVIDAKKRIGDALHKQKREGEAKKAYQSAADEFDKRALKPDQAPVASDAAAFSRFQLAEYELEAFDRVKIGGSGNALKNSFEYKTALVKKVNAAYDSIIKYKRIEWSLAAFYRKGYVLERFAATILETPVPPEVKRLGDEAVVTYQDALAQRTVALEDQAVANYTGTLAEAKKARISNEWTKKTLESLNRFRPKEFPMLKEPKQVMGADLVFSDGSVPTLEGKVRSQNSAQKLQGQGDDK
jgi:cellulose synthase operon protein C